MSTPYDGQIAIWHWKGQGLAENTIEDFVRRLKQWAPNVKHVFVKTTDGADWMARFDGNPNMHISGRASIQRWVQVLEANGMFFHAWCVAKGENVNAEADLIIETCNTPGVQSLIMDVEPYAGFWRVGKDPIRPYMTRIRRGVGGRFHIGMSVDPRKAHYNNIFPTEWRPFVNSIHPQVYWATFQRPVAQVMDEAWEVWGGYGLPIYPVLQGYAAPPAEVDEAREYVIHQKGAKGVSYWRYGVIGSAYFPVINKPIGPPDPVPPPPDPEDGRYGEVIVITPADPRFSTGVHTPEARFTPFNGTWGWTSFYTPSNLSRSTVWARWVPQITRSGYYEVSVFVPARHASTENARYRLHGVLGSSHELLLSVPQARYHNLWVSLGIFPFDASNNRAGIIFLNDLTGEAGKEIAYDAVRFREIIGDHNDQRYLADGYDAPIGTQAERATAAVWPGRWFDATGYAVRYSQGTPAEAYHTGADLNLNFPYFDADRDAPVYAAASGTVTFSGRIPGWGWVIVIRHDPLISTGQVTFGRYAHVNHARVWIGDRVARGQQIANIGNGDEGFPYHLHFDISHTTILERSPGDWPKLNLNRVLGDYTDPRVFIERHRPRGLTPLS